MAGEIFCSVVPGAISFWSTVCPGSGATCTEPALMASYRATGDLSAPVPYSVPKVAMSFTTVAPLAPDATGPADPLFTPLEGAGAATTAGGVAIAAGWALLLAP
uniref:Uncharacterized protein n=1 Tax=Anopheles melas TaxID=34690 RepID=A0A182ULK7_9DIPT